mmetsp:Transcript_24492/g.48876  ORF Transcript_24492/g.48876 Transcript_24492/m.48876 type:complete len:232 (+) Transcript_24492:2747-3442(+)
MRRSKCTSAPAWWPSFCRHRAAPTSADASASACSDAAFFNEAFVFEVDVVALAAECEVAGGGTKSSAATTASNSVAAASKSASNSRGELLDDPATTTDDDDKALRCSNSARFKRARTTRGPGRPELTTIPPPPPDASVAGLSCPCCWSLSSFSSRSFSRCTSCSASAKPTASRMNPTASSSGDNNPSPPPSTTAAVVVAWRPSAAPKARLRAAGDTGNTAPFANSANVVDA